jgi:hypothetical protein
VRHAQGGRHDEALMARGIGQACAAYGELLPELGIHEALSGRADECSKSEAVSRFRRAVLLPKPPQGARYLHTSSL